MENNQCVKDYTGVIIICTVLGILFIIAVIIGLTLCRKNDLDDEKQKLAEEKGASTNAQIKTEPMEEKPEKKNEGEPTDKK